MGDVDGGLVCIPLASPKTDPKIRTQAASLGRDPRNSGREVKNCDRGREEPIKGLF